jgi:hypothetical protein
MAAVGEKPFDAEIQEESVRPGSVNEIGDICEGDDLQLLEACNHTEVQLDRVQGSDNDVTVPSKRVRLSAKDDVSSLLSPKI